MTYPQFSPPPNIDTKRWRNWSPNETALHFDWFMSVWQHRVEDFVRLLQLRLLDSSELEIADARVLALLEGDEFSFMDTKVRKLTSEGRALAADFGLFFAKVLLDASGERIQWDVLKEPKNAVSINLPVLKGFGTLHLDPIRSSISHYTWLQAGNKPKNTWRQAFDFWLARAHQT